MHDGRQLGRIRALDGLRGLAVAGVLAYHLGFDWARGGFLGVSLFFTLSGFLITSLLLDERATTGSIRLGAFWVRRARRLLPAAMVALAGIVVFGATIATGSQLRDLRGDVLGALGYVANWRFVAAGTSYGDLWSSPSPVQHFWSLAIEEQLYVVLPLLVTGALVLGRGRRRLVAAALGLGLLGSLVATALVHDQLRAYYGTDVRAAELLVGALLAVVVTARPQFVRGAITRLGPPALVLLLAAWATTTQTDGRLYDGGLVVHALLVALVIVAARTDGALAALLSARPLRWLGRISYGAYLYHWPIFLWLDDEPAVVKLAVSLAAAWASAVLLEEPIRAGQRLVARRGPLALGATAIGLAACLVAVTASPVPPSISVDLTAGTPELIGPSLVTSVDTTSTSTASSAPTTTSSTTKRPGVDLDVQPVPRAPGERLRIYVAGDSNAFILGLNMLEWGERHGVDVWASGWFACHIVPGGEYRWADQPPKHTEDKCNDWRTTRAAEIEAINPHVVIVIYGSFDLLDRRFDGSDEWTHIGDPGFDAMLKDGIEEMTDLLGYKGARVLWATYPATQTGVIDGVWPDTVYPETAEYRVSRLNTFIREAVARRPFAGVIDLRRYMQTTFPGGELDRERRPDGIHPSDYEAVNIAQWAALQAVRAADR